MIDIAGDASILMNIQEMSTAVQFGLPVKVFILNNQYMGMVRQWQQLLHGNRISHSYTESLPDFVKLAEAYGGVGIRCDKPADLDDAIMAMLNAPADKPVLFDCRVAALANCFPMIPSGKAHHEMLLGEDVSDEEIGKAVEQGRQGAGVSCSPYRGRRIPGVVSTATGRSCRNANVRVAIAAPRATAMPAIWASVDADWSPARSLSTSPSARPANAAATIERQDAICRQSRSEPIESSIEQCSLVVFRGQDCRYRACISKTVMAVSTRVVSALRLVQPRNHARLGPFGHQLRDDVRIEDDHCRLKL